MITVNFVYFYSMKNNNLIQCHLKQDVKVVCSLKTNERRAPPPEIWMKDVAVSFLTLVISKRGDYSSPVF